MSPVKERVLWRPPRTARLTPVAPAGEIMAQVFRLSSLGELVDEQIDEAIRDAPRMTTMPNAVCQVIRAIHGLPEVLEADLSKLDVYIGRAGATSSHVRNRWSVRYEALKYAPSAHAAVILRGHTTKLMEERWEAKAQRLVEMLKTHHGLCCSNAVVGTMGKRPQSDDTAIYVVARVKNGPTGAGPQPARLLNALREILAEEELRDDVARQAAITIMNPKDAVEHEFAIPWDVEVPKEEELPTCRECGDRSAMTANRGFCGWCRRMSGEDKCRGEGCRNRRADGNYGFCGRHR